MTRLDQQLNTIKEKKCVVNILQPYFNTQKTNCKHLMSNTRECHFFSIHTYTHVQFEQLHKYIQKRNKIYKKWYTQKQSLDIKLFGISRKQKKHKNKQKGDVSS